MTLQMSPQWDCECKAAESTVFQFKGNVYFDGNWRYKGGTEPVYEGRGFGWRLLLLLRLCTTAATTTTTGFGSCLNGSVTPLPGIVLCFVLGSWSLM